MNFVENHERRERHENGRKRKGGYDLTSIWETTEKHLGFRGYARINTSEVNWRIRAYPGNLRLDSFCVLKTWFEISWFLLARSSSPFPAGRLLLVQGTRPPCIGPFPKPGSFAPAAFFRPVSGGRAARGRRRRGRLPASPGPASVRRCG